MVEDAGEITGRVEPDLPRIAVDYLFEHRSDIEAAVPKDGVGITRADLTAFSAQPSRTADERQLLGWALNYYDRIREFSPKGGTINWYALQEGQRQIAAAMPSLVAAPLADFLRKHESAAGKDHIFTRHDLDVLDAQLDPEEKKTNAQVRLNFDRIRNFDPNDAPSTWHVWEARSANHSGITQNDLDAILRKAEVMTSLGVSTN